VRFERKLEQHAEPGRQLQNARALFDLWIDAAEEAYAQVAMSDDFRHVYGGLANAQARLRLGVQREVEQVCTLFGMPTRTEVDSAHRKIVELERALRKLTRAQVSPARRAEARHAPAPVEAPVIAEPAPAPAPAKPKVAKARTLPRRTPAKAAPKKRAVAKKTAPKKRARRAVAAAAPAPTRKEPVPAVAKAAARTPARTKKAPARKTPRTVAAKPAPKKPAPTARAKPPSTSVVSMKDWVARNAARDATVDAPKTGRKTKRGSRK
jgi:hypothetical protein